MHVNLAQLSREETAPILILPNVKSLEDVPVFDTYIRVDSGIEWSQDNNAPIMAYKKSSRSATEYMELTKEIAKME